MKKLTRKQRAEIYLKVAEDLANEGKEWYALCPHLVKELKMPQGIVSQEKVVVIFKEFALFKPEYYNVLWWENNVNNYKYHINIRMTCMLLCHQMALNP